MRVQFPVLPGAVRKYKIQQFPFFGGRLILELGARLAGEFQQFDTLLDVALVRNPVGIHLASDPPLFGAEFPGLPAEELVVDAPVELVNVHGIDPILQAAVFALELCERALVKLFLVFVAIAKRGGHPFQRPAAERKALQNPREVAFQNLFPRVGLRVLPFVTSAVIVHVAAFLHLANHGAAAVAARDDPGECKVVRPFLGSLRVTATQHCLDLFPQFPAHQRLIRSVVPC